MSITQMLFSFEGRIRRRDFWLCGIGLLLVQWVLQSIIAVMFFPPIPVTVTTWQNGAGPWVTTYWSHYAGPIGIIGLLLLWPRLALGVKRFHDRNKSALWLLLCLVPVIGWIWLFIELGFFDGTPGPNRYGPSPKGIGGPEATAAA